ncbi:leucine rich repeat LRR-containing protein [Nitzschia inconspicua]|nr:leucine rich repeat LRR-containing protein [Nitzschia inconspicua]
MMNQKDRKNDPLQEDVGYVKQHFDSMLCQQGVVDRNEILLVPPLPNEGSPSYMDTLKSTMDPPLEVNCDTVVEIEQNRNVSIPVDVLVATSTSPIFVGDVMDGSTMNANVDENQFAESHVDADDHPMPAKNETTSEISSKSDVLSKLAPSLEHPDSFFEDSSNSGNEEEKSQEMDETITVISTTSSSLPTEVKDKQDKHQQSDAMQVRSYAYNLLKRLSDDNPHAGYHHHNKFIESEKSFPKDTDSPLPEQRPTCSRGMLLGTILVVTILLVAMAVSLAVVLTVKTTADPMPVPSSAAPEDASSFFPPTISPAPTTPFEPTSAECQSLHKQTNTQQYEAEDAVAWIGNATARSDQGRSGYCGTGYVALSQAGDRYVVGHAVLEASGYFSVTVRYSTPVPVELLVSVDSTPLVFLELNATDNENTWTVATARHILMKEGSPYLEVWIRNDLQHQVNIDWIALTRNIQLSRSQYMTAVLKQEYATESSNNWYQNASLAWMEEKDKIDWSTVSSQELVERYVLAQFYLSTYGEVWRANTGWLSPRHACDWYGIICMSTNQAIRITNIVTDVVLENNGLFGMLPDDLSLLNELSALTLNGNQMEGPLFVGIGGLASTLTHLALGHNRLYGTLPSELFALTKLEILSLQHNRLTGTLSHAINQMTALRELNLSFNAMTGTIPSSVAAMSKLDVIDVGGNSFHTPSP